MPMDDSKVETLRNTAWGLYDYIKENLYLNRTDLVLNGRKYNSALLMSMITALGQGKALLIGEPGLGKTTSAEWVSVLFYRMPLRVVWQATVSGHPEQTEEKIIGRPDLGLLNRGEEAVRWSYFTLLPTKIVDEINRLPETKQSMILDGVDRGKWEYLNDAVINDVYCLFATANYTDQGTHTIVAPLRDRFDVMVESKHPGANLAYGIGTMENDAHLFRHCEIEDKFHRLLMETIPHHERNERIENLCRSYGDMLLQELGIHTLSLNDLGAIGSHCRRIGFDADANAFFRMILSEFSFCHRFGQKRTHQACEEGCHFSEYLCHDVKSCLSNRFSKSVVLFSRVLAWLLGEDVVTVAHVKAVAPFAMAHRADWHERAIARWESQTRNDPLVIHMGKKAVGRIHRRYMEQGHLVKDALAAAYRIVEGENTAPIKGDHPIYFDILKDLDISGDRP